ncbi:MAG: ABC transporter permease, partial [Acidobacteriota bacterium]|nr:ABC transporter permease [Acidobacteriota bacterium]
MATTVARPPRRRGVELLPDLRLALDNLRQRKMRSLLTMLGMIFGVAAVISMLSIGAGAQKQAMAYIEQLGVDNLIVEAKEAANQQAFQKIRRISPGLTFQDLRLILANVDGIALSTPRKQFAPSKMIPRPSGEIPTLYGVDPDYEQISNLRIVDGRFFNKAENARSAPVCVLGQGAE